MPYTPRGNFAWELIYSQGCACWIWNWTEGSGWHSERSSSGCRHLMSHFLIKVPLARAQATVPESGAPPPGMLPSLPASLPCRFLLFCFHPSMDRSFLHAFFMTLPFLLLGPLSPCPFTAIPFPELHSTYSTYLFIISYLTPTSPKLVTFQKHLQPSSITVWKDDCFGSAFERTVVMFMGFSCSCGGQCVSSRLRCSGCTVRLGDFWSDGPGTFGR